VRRVARDAEQVPVDAPTFEAARAAIARGLAYLAKAQTTRGTWFESQEVTPTDMEPRKRAASVAVTALALKAFAQAGELGDAEAHRKARAAVQAVLADETALAQVTEGGIGNYVMSAVASGLSAVGDIDSTAGAERAIRWLRDGQWDDAEGIDSTKDWYGGAGYGNGKRPDLSNTQMMLDAMHDAGVSADDPAMQRALDFVARTQNRKASNPASWAQDGAGDGGFVYSPANGGESFASDAAGEGRYGEKLAVRSLRSYGSMTYAGFKSMLYAGLSPDDPRVKDALGWIAAHWTFDENPGLGQQGYFYYLHTMSRALHASRVSSVTDAKGAPHDWRKELVAALAARQREDGSWRNSAERWEESNESLATIYAVLALEEAIKPSSPTTE
jgi:squalene-hopene/tetraprenyl-beta-curcumene cyclase